MFSVAAEAVATRAMRLLDDVRELQQHWRVQTGKPRRDSAAEALALLDTFERDLATTRLEGLSGRGARRGRRGPGLEL